MKYLFEDDERDVLSKLFCSCYNKDTAGNNFMFLSGNGEFKKTVELLIESGEDKIFVFIDSVPDNKRFRRLYYGLRCLCLKFKGRIMVFPIVCAEYYFLKSILKYEYLIKDIDTVKKCVMRTRYRTSYLLQDDITRKYVKNFEKYCKVLLKNDNVLRDCFHSKLGESSFYNCDCVCNFGTDCVEFSYMEKAKNYLCEYPCFPSGSVLDEHVLDWDEIVNIHKSLVDDFNSWLNRMIKTGELLKDEVLPLAYCV